MILLVGASVAWATTPDNLEPLRCKEVLQIQQAAATKDPVQREQALREAIRDGLLSTDPAVRREVFSYLSQNDRWLDLRPYTDLLEQYAAIPAEGGRGLRLADDVELFRAPRERRVEACRHAITEGTVRLRRGTEFIRFTAILLAARDGLNELTDVIQAYHSEMHPKEQGELPLAQVMLRLDLGAGAKDLEDALRLASQRLAKLDATEFAGRMDSDPIFKQTVLQTARDACAANPFTHELNPGCCAIREIAARQKRLHDQRDAEMKAAGTPPAPVEIGGPSTWLDQLREVSQPIRLSPPQGQEAP
jgi:hypothetical protein